MIPDDFNMSTLLEQVLQESGYADQRASKMDVDDFLKCVILSRAASRACRAAELTSRAPAGSSPSSTSTACTLRERSPGGLSFFLGVFVRRVVAVSVVTLGVVLFLCAPSRRAPSCDGRRLFLRGLRLQAHQSTLPLLKPALSVRARAPLEAMRSERRGSSLARTSRRARLASLFPAGCRLLRVVRYLATADCCSETLRARERACRVERA